MKHKVLITDYSDLLIHEIASLTGKTEVEILEEALRIYRHHERMRLLNKGYGNLKGDKLWQQKAKN